MRLPRCVHLGVLLVACSSVLACSAPASPPPGGDVGVVCSAATQCDDGVFCNGAERCDPDDALASADGCVEAAPPCPTAACDEAGRTCFGVCPDADGDGHESAACGGDDCDDADADRFPGNPEVCDLEGHDEDCDATTLGARDLDRDGFDDARCCNTDGQGARVCGEDCNDARRNQHPLASEVCDYVDNNCDGFVDDGVALEGYRDRDQDGRGDAAQATTGCPGYPGFSLNVGDCDDADPARSDLQPEACDGVDNDCDPSIDEESRPVPWYDDLDDDGFGEFAVDAPLQCEPPNDGGDYSIVSADCDDGRAGVSPLGVEICNGRDDDCNGRADFVIAGTDTEDDDRDGFADAACGGDDCDDLDYRTHPGAFDGVDGRDNDCDGEVDECAAPGDCAACGDGACAGAEDARSCPLDCAPACPDGLCTHDESASSCAADCACAEGERVDSGECVPCAPGYLRAAGDDASGADTACAPDACILALGHPCSSYEGVYIKSSNSDTEDYFGLHAVLEGDLLIVGAPGEDGSSVGVNVVAPDDNAAAGTGAIYVFHRDADDRWTEEAQIKPPDNALPYAYGTLFDFQGDTLAVRGAGGVHVYVRAPEGTWTLQQQVEVPALVHAIVVDGDTLVTAYTGFAAGVGRVYVFTRDDAGVWSPQADFTGSNTEAGDHFGTALALRGDVLAVAADSEDSIETGIGGTGADNDAAGSGAVYIFERTGSAWAQAEYIKASNAEASDQFGWSLDLSGDTLVVGSRWEASDGSSPSNDGMSGSGAAYVFVRDGNGDWTEEAYLKASNPKSSDHFGNYVAIDGDLLIVGVPDQDGDGVGLNGAQTTSGASASGAAYVFRRDGSNVWTQIAYLKATNADAGDELGEPVCVSGDTVVGGAPLEDSNARGVGGDQSDFRSPDSGAVYVWRLPPSP